MENGQVELQEPQPFQSIHHAADFDCGVIHMNEWLRKHGLDPHNARTYVALTDDGRVGAYYCLAAGSVERKSAPGKLKRNAPDPIPAVVLGRMAVDSDFQRKGIGGMLVAHAKVMAYQAARIAGARLLILTARTTELIPWYAEHGFVSSKADTREMMIAMATIEVEIAAAQAAEAEALR